MSTQVEQLKKILKEKYAIKNELGHNRTKVYLNAPAETIGELTFVNFEIISPYVKVRASYGTGWETRHKAYIITPKETIDVSEILEWIALHAGYKDPRMPAYKQLTESKLKFLKKHLYDARLDTLVRRRIEEYRLLERFPQYAKYMREIVMFGLALTNSLKNLKDQLKDLSEGGNGWVWLDFETKKWR